jgi:DNA invertase Pin-like site-specific DNA recombinase
MDEKASTSPATGRLVGYARVSTKLQDSALQLDALAAAGVPKPLTFTDQGVSGKLTSRPALDKCLAALREGDTLVVWKLDRLGRSVQHLVETVNGLAARGVGFRSLTEGIDTTTNGGKLVFHIFAALAEFERGLIQERTLAGLEAARERGHHGGRRPVLSPEAVKAAASMHAAGQPIAAIARTLKVSRPVIYRALERKP